MPSGIAWACNLGDLYVDEALHIKIKLWDEMGSYKSCLNFMSPAESMSMHTRWLAGDAFVKIRLKVDVWSTIDRMNSRAPDTPVIGRCNVNKVIWVTSSYSSYIPSNLLMSTFWLFPKVEWKPSKRLHRAGRSGSHQRRMCKSRNDICYKWCWMLEWAICYLHGLLRNRSHDLKELRWVSGTGVITCMQDIKPSFLQTKFENYCRK